MVTQRRILGILSSMVMISAFLPIVFANLPPVVRSHHIWAILWIATLVIVRPVIFNNRIVQILLLLGSVIFMVANDIVWVNIDQNSKKMIYYEFYEISIAVTIIIYYRTEKDYLGLAKLVKLTIACIVITAIMSIITSYVNPMFARDIVGVADANESEKEEILSFKKFGGGSYGFYSALLCLFPLLIFQYKNQRNSIWSKKIILVYILIFFFCLISVQIFANVIIAGLLILLSIIFSSKNIFKSVLITGVFLTILYLIPSQVYVDVFQYLAKVVGQDSHLALKFEDMATFIETGKEVGEKTEAGIRMERFPLLWDSFISDPLIGGEYYNHHLHWMNKLATFGIIGIFPYVILFISFWKFNMKFYPPNYKPYLLLSIFSIITLGIIKALFGRELWLAFFVIVPGMYYVGLLKPNKAKSVNENPSHQ